MSQGALFPLPLVAFERYMLADERPDFPMTFHLRLDVSGTLDERAFTLAVGEAVGRHPLLRAVVRRLPGRGLCWVPLDAFDTPISWASSLPAVTDPEVHQLDIRERPGIRLWVERQPGGARVTFLIHHAICDGIGAFEFVGDMLAAYARRTGGGDPLPAAATVTPEVLRRRGDFPVELPEPVSTGRIVWDATREAFRWLAQRSAPLAIPAGNEPSDGQAVPFPGCLLHSFSADETARLRRAASRRDAMANDLLLRDMFLAIAQWNREHGPDRPGDWLRINMPTGLRGPCHANMPAANAMSYAFLTRRARACGDPAGLLQSVRAETELIKRWHLGLFFIDGLRAVQRVPGAMQWMVAGNRCFATVVLTNLGNAARRFRSRFPRQCGKVVAGDVVVENLLGVPPVRPMTHATFAVSQYAGQLHVWMRVNPRLFTRCTAEQLLQCFVGQVRQSIDEA